MEPTADTPERLERLAKELTEVYGKRGYGTQFHYFLDVASHVLNLIESARKEGYAAGARDARDA